MRVGLAALMGAICLLMASGQMSSANAEGFFEKLFGWTTAPAASAPPASDSYRTAPVPPKPASENQGRRDRDSALETSGRYRTLCVRTCDGYYFPVSFSASRRDLHRDADSCRASCGQQAQLFYQSNKIDDVKDMVDLSGRSYSNMPNAFKYRKTYVEGCKCKPDPWEQSELDRHKRYAMGEEAVRQPDAPNPSRVVAQTPVADPEIYAGGTYAAPNTSNVPANSEPQPTEQAAARDDERIEAPSKSQALEKPIVKKVRARGIDSKWITTSQHARRQPTPQSGGFLGLGFGSQQRLRFPGD